MENTCLARVNSAVVGYKKKEKKKQFSKNLRTLVKIYENREWVA